MLLLLLVLLLKEEAAEKVVEGRGPAGRRCALVKLYLPSINMTSSLIFTGVSASFAYGIMVQHHVCVGRFLR